MLDKVREIIATDFDVIKSTSKSVLLLKVYSQLYLKGAQPKSCEKAMFNYYCQIKKNGLKMAKKMEEKRTNKLRSNIKGLMYVGKPYCKHFNLEFLSDKEAIDLLKLGVVKERDFIDLPENFKKEPVKKRATKKKVTKKVTEEKIDIPTEEKVTKK